MKFVWRIVDLVVGGIFIYAGAIKALDPAQFANDIDNYKILPWTISVGLAFYLPWLEMLCGLALIFRQFYRGAFAILTALISIFLVATIAAKLRGLDITCGCFGHASQHWNFSARSLSPGKGQSSFAGVNTVKYRGDVGAACLFFDSLDNGKQLDRHRAKSTINERGGIDMIRKLRSGDYRLYSRRKNPRTGKRRNLGTFKTKAAAKKHERAVQYFKRR